MAELTIRPEEIRSALERFVQAYEPDAAAREEVGTVTECFDGIAFVAVCLVRGSPELDRNCVVVVKVRGTS